MGGYAPLFPPNATPLERGLDKATARVDRLDVAPYRAARHPATCPPALLPWLANDVSIDSWSPAWSDAAKRAAITLAIPLQRMKGTVAAVKMALQPFGGQAAIREWWQTTPPGPVHTFTVVLTLPGSGGGAPSAALIEAAVEQIHRAKPARSHFTFALASQAVGGFGPIGRVRAATCARAVASCSQSLAA